MAFRKKYNYILEELIASRHNHYVMDLHNEMYHLSHYLQTPPFNTLNARVEFGKGSITKLKLTTITEAH